jgi:hypothetical protein
MTDDKWQQLIDVAELQFDNVEKRTEDLVMDTPDGPQKNGTRDILIFENPLGRFKLVRESKPKVLSKKEHYTHRPGDTSRTEYTMSDTEMTHKLHVYKDEGYDDWEEIAIDKVGLSM